MNKKTNNAANKAGAASYFKRNGIKNPSENIKEKELQELIRNASSSNINERDSKNRDYSKKKYALYELIKAIGESKPIKNYNWKRDEYIIAQNPSRFTKTLHKDDAIDILLETKFIKHHPDGSSYSIYIEEEDILEENWFILNI